MKKYKNHLTTILSNGEDTLSTISFGISKRVMFDEQGEIEIKGKGMMRTWILEKCS